MDVETARQGNTSTTRRAGTACPSLCRSLLLSIGLLFAGLPGCTVGSSLLGSSDATVTDTAVQDLGAADTVLTDTGLTDTGLTDTGLTDTGPADASMLDTEVMDVGPADATPPLDALGCPATLSVCPTGCVDLQSDTNHCGDCGTVCPGASTCMGGTCIGMPPCMPPLTLCATSCTSIATDPANCGACGNGCHGGHVCVRGTCVAEGALRFTLTWDAPADMDLHVVPPCGTEIDQRSVGMPVCGGTLDRNDTTGPGPEDITFDSAPASGSYVVCAIPSRIIGKGGTRRVTATVEAFENGALRASWSHTFTATDVSACTTMSTGFLGSYIH